MIPVIECTKPEQVNFLSDLIEPYISIWNRDEIIASLKCTPRTITITLDGVNSYYSPLGLVKSEYKDINKYIKYSFDEWLLERNLKN